MTSSRKHHLQILLLASGIAFVGGAFAADDWKSGKSAEEKFKMMDSDGNGSVSAAEHAAGAERMFVDLDADKDGNVTAAEMDAAHPAAGAAREGRPVGKMSSADKIKTIDSNADGSLSAAEHASGSQARFTKADTDGDGSLTVDEVKASHAAMMGKKDE